MNNWPILGMEFVLENRKSKGDVIAQHDGSSLRDLTTGAIANLFAMFYEIHIDGIFQVFGTDMQNWPEMLNFCRTVRNAIYHSHTINIINQSSKPVAWHHIVLGPANKGFKIIDSYALELGDILLLTKEFSEFLDAHGVPIPN